MTPGMKPPTKLKSMRTMICRADHIARASARRAGWALSERKGTWLTQTKAMATPPTNENASSAPGDVVTHRPTWETASSRPEAMRKGRRPRRSLRMPVGSANRPVANGAMLATWPMKSSW